MDIEVGGQIQGISLGSFLQIVHMDKTTCTLKIYSDDDIGYLYLKDGALVAAETGHLQNVEAAYEILSWNKTVIIIDNAPIPNQKITMSLMSILMEGLRRKDEKNAQLSEQAAPSEMKELDVEFDPETYVSKDDQIASQFVVSDTPEKEAAVDALPDLPFDAVQSIDAAPPLPVDHLKRELEDELNRDTVSPKETQPADDAGETVDFEGEDEIEPIKISFGRRVLRLAVFIVAMCGITFGSLIAYKIYISREGYDRVIDQVKAQKNLQTMKTVLTAYINNQSDDSRYVADAISKKEDVELLISIEKKIATMSMDDDYQNKSTALYKDFLAEHRNSFMKDYAQAKLDEIPKAVEAYDFKKLNSLAESRKQIKMKAYKDFIKNHPDSKNIQAVRNMIAALSDEYYIELIKEVARCNQSGKWDTCLALDEEFVANFSDDQRINEVSLMKNKARDKVDLSILRVKTSRMNFNDAKQAYNDYIDKNPETTIKKDIRDDIFTLNRKIDVMSKWEETRSYCTNSNMDVYMRIKELKEFMDRDTTGVCRHESAALMRDLKEEERAGKDRTAQLLQDRQDRDLQNKMQAERDRVTKEREKLRVASAKKSERDRKMSDEAGRLSKIFGSSGRFRINTDKTVSDTRTGLMWTLVDSYTAEGECMDFDTARNYVRNLNTGGYRDWRIPDGSELAVIYNSKPYFPSSGAKWYWTSKASSNWNSGDKSEVFYPDRKDEFVRVLKDQSDCGFVHAVRP